jgi:hypothetical protein
VATQALYLLNDPFVRRQSLAFAEKLLAGGEADDVERVGQAYRLTLGRRATAGEIDRALEYVKQYESAVQAPTPPPVADAESTVAVAETSSTADSATDANAPDKPAGKKKKKKQQPQNPDEMEQGDEPLAEEPIRPSTAQAAAWASFCQALLGSAEFRYLK